MNPSSALDSSGNEHVLLRTSAGDLILELFDKGAPQTVSYFKQLVSSGIYDGTQIFRVEPGFVIQTSMVEARDAPLTSKQQSLLRSVPFEASSFKHLRGSLSFAHPDGNPDGGTSSFSIMLNDAPHLDGKYVVFGRVVVGQDVMEEIASVPLSLDNQPLIHIGLEAARIFSRPEAERQRVSRRTLYSAAAAYLQNGLRVEIAALISALLFGTIAMSLLAGHFSRRVYQAIRLIILLTGGFGLLLVLFPLAIRTPSIGAALFFGLIGLFKLLGRFETAREGDGRAQGSSAGGRPLFP